MNAMASILALAISLLLTVLTPNRILLICASAPERGYAYGVWPYQPIPMSNCHTGWGRHQDSAGGQDSFPLKWASLTSDHIGLEPICLEPGRGRKASNNASVNALAQRRYHQKLKVRYCFDRAARFLSDAFLTH